MYADLSEKYYTRWVSDSKDSLSDETLELAWELMRAKNFDRMVFYEREDRISLQEFKEWTRDKQKLSFGQFRHDGTPISLCWLTDLSRTGRQTFSHFTTLDTVSREEAVESGRLLIQYVGKITKIKEFIGLTPGCYRHALAFAYDLGFKKLTTLEKAVICLGKERDAILSMCKTQG